MRDQHQLSHRHSLKPNQIDASTVGATSLRRVRQDKPPPELVYCLWHGPTDRHQKHDQHVYFLWKHES